MSPFQQFRFWARRAPASERVVAGVAVVVVALVAVLLAPTGGGSSSDLTAVAQGPAQATAGSGAEGPSTTAAPDAAAGGTAGAAGSATSGSGSNGTAESPTVQSAGSAPAGGCTSPPGNAPGVTATEIKIAVTLTEIIGPGANTTFGLPSTGEQQQYYELVIDSINASGGVACRKLVPRFYSANPADQSDLQQKCLDIAQAGLFAVLDFTAYTGGGTGHEGCFAQRQIPYFVGYFVHQSHVDSFYPYVFGFNTFNRLYRDTVFALRDRGVFAGGGFKKLGFIYRSCEKALINDFTGWLHEAGLSDAQIVTFDVGCPSALSNPADLQQAVLKFQQNGVTHVTTVQFLGDFGNFTKIAQRQGFRPKYVLGDDNLINQTYGNQGPDPENLADAIAIVGSAWGEERTPGMTPSPATARCNAIYQPHGLPPVYEQKSAAGGRICDQLWMFQAAVGNAPAISRTALVAGLQRAKSIEFSFPQGPNDFSGNRLTTGGQFWRVDQFMLSCRCWQVIDREFKRSY